MKKPKLFWQIYPAFLAITLLSLLMATWYAARSLRDLYLEEMRLDLKARALLLEDRVAALLPTRNFEAIDDLCKSLGRKSLTRLTVILPSGKVIGDSDENPADMDNHAGRPEVIEAMSGRIGSTTRYSHTLNKEMMYVAIPLRQDAATIAVLRTSIPVASLAETLGAAYLSIIFGVLGIGVLASMIGLMVSRRITRPLEEMKRGAEAFARGELGRRLTIPNSEEMGDLAEMLNQMAEQLDERIRTVTRQRNEREAILASMVEGVIAVDSQERIFSINHAASEMIGDTSENIVGKSVQEAIRNTALQEFVAKALSARGLTEGDIVLERGGQRCVQVHGAPLRDASGNNVGAVVVLNDVSRMKKLEEIRREFVANVSHELRTPITSIKGFVETLLDGTVREPEEARRFLGIILKQTNRLNAIIEDLLLLSSLEQDGGQKVVRFEEVPLKPILETAIDICQIGASGKKIIVSLRCEQDLMVKANVALLEQAVVNLLDNAIKYSGEGSSVDISAGSDAKGVTICVRDKGCGIGKEHLPRLFERFYRADKARSRKLGGTGLGLAIVKHVVQAHGGSVSVESAPGEGSTFRIHLPAA